MLLVTGGAGFIGSNFVLNWIQSKNIPLVNLDKLTYAGNRNNLAALEGNSRHIFVEGDIADRALVHELLHKYQPRAIVHFAAETHVDRSIDKPENFLFTNVDGSFALLQETYSYWKKLPSAEQNFFRFLNVSTDEVFGSLALGSPPSTEGSPFFPNSPYAASKASFDHFVRSYFHTYKFPSITTHCSNNFGPYQFPEKLIPLMIVQALRGQALPVYGDGKQIRNWIYVKDHCEALEVVLNKGKPGESYNIGSEKGMTNLELIHLLCALLDKLKPESPFRPHAQLIQHIKDRPGHDRRYDLDSSKIKRELEWHSRHPFEQALRETVRWYLENQAWLESATNENYRLWMAKHYS